MLALLAQVSGGYLFKELMKTDGEIAKNVVSEGVGEAIKSELESTGAGYNVHCEILDAKDYGLPQDRQRIFIVGVRNDLDFKFEFPRPTHGEGLLPYVSMKEYGVKDIPSLETEVFKERKENREDYFSSRYMSRNRIRKWNDVSFTIPAEAQQVPADPSCKKMWDVDVIGENRPKDREWAEFRKAHD